VPVVQPLPRSLRDAFAEFERPSTDAAPVAGAVDLRRIKPTRPEARKPAEPPPPSHPSRIWVQVATGRDKTALGSDWRRMTRDKTDVFHGKQASISAWGQTNRLLTGPFQSEAAANAFIAQLRRTDVDGAFVWTSPAGQVVDALAGSAVAAQSRDEDDPRTTRRRDDKSRTASRRDDTARETSQRQGRSRTASARRDDASRDTARRETSSRSTRRHEDASQSDTKSRTTSRKTTKPRGR
jgi:hypothetical protein